MNEKPVFANVADLFTWKVTATIPSNVVGQNAANSLEVKILSDSYFCFMAWVGSTNYDGCAGDFRAVIGSGPAAATTLVSPPTVPNNFEVRVTRENTVNMMGAPMPQAAVCSNGYHSGRQVPWPIMYPPNSTFQFDLWNVARTLLTEADQTTPIPLEINFGMFGYNVPLENLGKFLESYWQFRDKAFAQLTRQRMTGLL